MNAYSTELHGMIYERLAALSQAHQKSAGPRTNRVAPRYKLRNI